MPAASGTPYTSPFGFTRIPPGRAPATRGYKNQVFRTTGEFGDFIDLWLDGRKLTKDVDYLAESGSTVITIFGETLDSNDNGNGDTHTIAAEFREGDKEDGTLKRAAQNYVIEGVSKPTNPTPSIAC